MQESTPKSKGKTDGERAVHTRRVLASVEPNMERTYLAASMQISHHVNSTHIQNMLSTRGLKWNVWKGILELYMQSEWAQDPEEQARIENFIK